MIFTCDDSCQFAFTNLIPFRLRLPINDNGMIMCKKLLCDECPLYMYLPIHDNETVTSFLNRLSIKEYNKLRKKAFEDTIEINVNNILL